MLIANGFGFTTEFTKDAEQEDTLRLRQTDAGHMAREHGRPEMGARVHRQLLVETASRWAFANVAVRLSAAADGEAPERGEQGEGAGGGFGHG